MFKKILFVVYMIVVITPSVFSQSYNQDRVVLSNYLTRMYMNQPFEGVKIVQDYDHTYLLSVVLVNASTSESATNRIAQVKCNRQISQYLGALTVINSETIIKTTENSKGEINPEEITDIIKENSIGYTRSMEILNVLDLDDGKKCYLFIRDIREMQ